MAGPSTLMRVTEWLLPIVRGSSLADVERFRGTILKRTPPREAPLPASLRARCEVSEVTFDGQTAITLTPKAGRRDWHLVYLHGGAFVNPLDPAHWSIVRALMDATGARVTVPLYALAPENDHRRGLAFLEWICHQAGARRPAERIALAGDSAGGNLALVLTLRCRAKQLPLPDRLFLFAPWLDLTLADPAAREVEPRDVLLGIDALRECGAWWAGQRAPQDPELSPLYADLHGLPPVSIFQGTHDLFVADARSFVGKARAAGVDVRYFEYPGAFHVFMAATFTREARDVFGHVAALL